MINSHAEKDEDIRISKLLPKLETLKKLGVKKIVYGIETYFDSGHAPTANSSDTSFWNASEIHKWIKSMADKGIEVKVIGYDYRHKDKNSNNLTRPESQSDHEINYRQNQQNLLKYTESLPEDRGNAFAQNKNGKRYLLIKQNGKMEKILPNGFAKQLVENEKEEFLRDLQKQFPDYDFAKYT